MANEGKKDFNAMLHDNKDMPKFQTVTDSKSIETFGGSRMYFAPPIDYDRIMRRIPYGKVVTVSKIREYLAIQNGADFTDPFTAGIFVSIAAWASHQRSEDETPYWRTLKADGELNPKYPGGIEAQKEKLEAEGHVIIQKGRKNLRYYVKDYENALFDLKGETPLKLILCGSVKNIENDKVGVVSVVFATYDQTLAEQKIHELKAADADDYYMLYDVPLNVDLTELAHYPSIAITRSDLQ